MTKQTTIVVIGSLKVKLFQQINSNGYQQYKCFVQGFFVEIQN